MVPHRHTCTCDTVVEWGWGWVHEITSARTPASSPLRAAAVLPSYVRRAFEILGASGIKTAAIRAPIGDSERPAPPIGGVCSPTITPSGIRGARLARSGASLAGAIFTPAQPPLIVNSQTRRQI